MFYLQSQAAFRGAQHSRDTTDGARESLDAECYSTQHEFLTDSGGTAGFRPRANSGVALPLPGSDNLPPTQK